MPKTTMDWIGGSQLVRAGLIARKQWVVDAAEEAMTMPWPSGLGLNAVALASTHRHGLSTLRSAPILAAVAGTWDGNSKARMKALARWREQLDLGLKLRELLDAYGVPYPLRAMQPNGLVSAGSGLMAPIMAALALVPPSTLAQAIPETPESQRLWLIRVASAVERLPMMGGGDEFNTGLMSWFAINARLGASAAFSVPDLMDFFASLPEPPNPRWSLDRAIELSAAWHAEMVTRDHEVKFLRRWGVGYDAKASLPRGFPETIEVTIPVQTEMPLTVPKGTIVMDEAPIVSHAVYEATALLTGRALAEETAAQHHCVADYAGKVHSGLSVIYSITKDGKRTATLEIQTQSRGNQIGQFKRFGNGKVEPGAPEWRVVQKIREHVATHNGRATGDEVRAKAGGVFAGAMGAYEGMRVAVDEGEAFNEQYTRALLIRTMERMRNLGGLGAAPFVNVRDIT